MSVQQEVLRCSFILLDFQKAEVVHLKLGVDTEPLLLARFAQWDNRVIDRGLELIEVLPNLERLKIGEWVAVGFDGVLRSLNYFFSMI